MALIGNILGLGRTAQQVGEAVGSVAEVFVGNRADREAAAAGGFVAALDQYGSEFTQAPRGWFDGVVNGLNRLPRPMLALGTLGLFVYAMAEPAGFAERMQGLQLVPEPLWWLLGAVVSFYFGARELHHFRQRQGPAATVVAPSPAPAAMPAAEAQPTRETVARTAPVTKSPRPLARPQGLAAPVAVEPQRVVAAEAASAARVTQPASATVTPILAAAAAVPSSNRAADPTYNAAVEEWRQLDS